MRAVIYARVSTEEQANKELSIPSQVELCKQYAVNNGIEIVNIFVDAGKSGTTSEREAFQELISQCKQSLPPFEAILVYNYARFSRNELDSIVYEELLERNNIKLISITQPLPEDSAIRTLVRGIFRVIDTWYSKNASQEARRGQISLIKQGYYCGGTVPYGYTLVEAENGHKKLVPDPETAPIIKMIYDMVVARYSYNDIINFLHLKGIKPPKGQYWRRNTLSNIIHNPIYKGCFAYGRRQSRKNQRRPKEQWIILEDTHEAIVSKELWERAQRTKSKYTPKPRSDALLSSLLYCAKCGAKMWYKKRYQRGKQYGNYICSNREESNTCDMPAIASSIIEPIVVKQVIDTLLSEDINKIIAKALEEREMENEYKRLIEITTKELEQVYRARKNVLRGLEILDLSDEDFVELNKKLSELKEREEELKDKIQEYQSQLKTDVLSPDEIREILEEVRNIAENLDRQDREELREFLQLVVSKITLDTTTRQFKIVIKLPVLENQERGQVGSP